MSAFSFCQAVRNSDIRLDMQRRVLHRPYNFRLVRVLFLRYR